MAGNCCHGRFCSCRADDRYKASYNALTDPPPQCTCTWVCRERMEGTYGTPPPQPQPRPEAHASCCLVFLVRVVLAVLVLAAVIIVISVVTH